MRSVYVYLPTVEIVQRFIEQISPLEGYFDLLSGGYILDAKSLMGVLSLDLKKPLKLVIEKDTEEAMLAIAPFLEDSNGQRVHNPDYRSAEKHSPDFPRWQEAGNAGLV